MGGRRGGRLTSDAMTWSRRRAVAAGLAALAVAGRSRADTLPPSFNGKRRPWTILRPRKPAPALLVTTPEGRVVDTGRVPGRLLLVNFWATWCVACLAELPDLDRLQRLLGPERLRVVPVNLDRDGKRVAAPYFARLGIRDLPLYLDPAGHSADRYGLREGLPWSFLVDADRRIAGYMMGAAHWTGDDGLRLLRHYLRKGGG